ncbi:flavonol synthase/flavanone 3-hydroxylase [Iris pallida]|nr:flavonol synthase/flavanone 3-hydroxylase [Iris pallida]
MITDVHMKGIWEMMCCFPTAFLVPDLEAITGLQDDGYKAMVRMRIQPHRNNGFRALWVEVGGCDLQSLFELVPQASSTGVT